MSGEAQVYDRLFTVRPEVTIERLRKTDLVIIPPVNGDMGEAVEANRAFLPWIVKQYKSGAEVASLCVGAVLLAATGLLDGRKCATHWIAANEFRRRYPKVQLVPESVLTAEAGIFTSGGANSFWNVLLYLLERHTDREIAVYASKFYELEIDRGSQGSFLIFDGQKDQGDEPVRRVQHLIEGGYRDPHTVDSLCRSVALGRRSLGRRFKQATGNTVSEYLQRVRVEAAKRSFETSRKTVTEVMYETGCSDTKAFRSVFSRIAGMSPLDYRKRYRREAATA